MKIRRYFVLCQFLICGFISNCYAVMPKSQGWYVGGNIGRAKINNISFGANTEKKNTGIAWIINGGYKIMPYGGLEIGYSDYGKTEVTHVGTDIINASQSSLHAALKGVLPVGETGFELFAKLGVSRVKSDNKVSNFSYVAANNLSINARKKTVGGYFVGFGAGYAWRPDIIFNLGWQRVKGNKDTGRLDLKFIGVEYLFG